MLLPVLWDLDLLAEWVVVADEASVLPGFVIEELLMLLVKVLPYLLARQLIEVYIPCQPKQSTYHPYAASLTCSGTTSPSGYCRTLGLLP